MHKLWPRVSALGERLWSDPETNWKQVGLDYEYTGLAQKYGQFTILVRPGDQLEAGGVGLCY